LMKNQPDRKGRRVFSELFVFQMYLWFTLQYSNIRTLVILFLLLVDVFILLVGSLFLGQP
jgi:hypothetical protein